MKDYHFENGESNNFDETIRLDVINEQVKHIEPTEEKEDDLGNADDFLNVFESEQLDKAVADEEDTQPELPSGEEETKSTPTLPPMEETKKTEKTEQPKEKTDEESEEEGSFWNKKTIGMVTAGGVVALLLCFLFVKLFFFGSVQEKTPVLQEPQLMLVESVLSDDRLLLYNTKTGEEKAVALTEKTTITDEQGKPVSSHLLQAGDFLMVALNDDGTAMVSGVYEAVETQTVTEVTVNTAQKRLETPDGTFTYDDHTVFLYGDEPILPEEIEPCDVLTLAGQKGQVWRVMVEEFHGYLEFSNKEAIKNGTVQIDDEDPLALAQVDKLALAAGEHQLTIKGENIEVGKEKVIIREDESTVYDLSKAQKKMGVLVIDANVADYKLYLNGNLTDETKPAVLPFGEYDVVILKDGYKEFNQKVTLRQDTVSITAELEKTEPEGDKYGTVAFKSNVPDTEVWVDGVNMGMTPLQIDLLYGTHQVVFHKEGYTDQTQTVVVENAMTAVNGALS